MGDENNGFFFFFSFCMWDSIIVLTFLLFCKKKIKLKDMLFQNLYEDILVRQKLKKK